MIRTVVAQPPDGRVVPESRAPVFVVSADARAPISLEVQAGLADALHSFATIRFVDKRSEAIDATDPRKRVVDNGILVTLGQIPPGARVVDVEAQRYESVGADAAYRIRLERSDSTWKLVRVTST